VTVTPTAAWPAASTRPVALLGDPVDHSLSPRLHNTVFRRAGLDLVYLALPVPSAAVTTVLEALGAVGAVGANVTVPHKLRVHAHCDRLTDEAVLVGAVNTVWWRGGALHGTNTDATGLERVLRRTVDGLAGAPAVVLGTGGAARAAVVALARSGAVPTVVGRRREPLDEVVAVARRAGAEDAAGVELTADALGAVVGAARVVVNATPLGMAGERLPPPFHALGPDQVAHDLVYGAGTTPFVADARAVGADGHDGRAMLAAQAHDAFVVWTGEEPPSGAYEDALDA
jgi:shikimate dehydrogenase